MRIDIYATVVGISVGLGSALLFRWISARLPPVDFWRPATSLARSLLFTADVERFFARYGELLILLGRYLWRQALVVALPVGAAVVVLMLALPDLAERSVLSLASLLPVCVGYGVAILLWKTTPLWKTTR